MTKIFLPKFDDRAAEEEGLLFLKKKKQKDFMSLSREFGSTRDSE